MPEAKIFRVSPVIAFFTLMDVITLTGTGNSSNGLATKVLFEEEEACACQDDQSLLALVLSLTELKDLLAGTQQIPEVAHFLAPEQPARLAETLHSRSNTSIVEDTVAYCFG